MENSIRELLSKLEGTAYIVAKVGYIDESKECVHRYIFIDWIERKKDNVNVSVYTLNSKLSVECLEETRCNKFYSLDALVGNLSIVINKLITGGYEMRLESFEEVRIESNPVKSWAIENIGKESLSRVLRESDDIEDTEVEYGDIHTGCETEDKHGCGIHPGCESETTDIRHVYPGDETETNMETHIHVVLNSEPEEEIVEPEIEIGEPEEEIGESEEEIGEPEPVDEGTEYTDAEIQSMFGMEGEEPKFIGVETPFNTEVLDVRVSDAITKNYNKPEEEKRLSKIGVGCIKCNFNGYTKDPLTGITTICDCQHREELKLKNQKLEEEIFKARQAQLEVKNKELFEILIPEHRRDIELRIEEVKAHISRMSERQGVKVRYFNLYADALENILTSITYGELDRSYIIGAPNGFGKETMVYTAMKLLLAQDKKVVPYKSLVELAKIKAEYEKDLMRQLRFGSSNSHKETEKPMFTWTDYLEADVLFTYLSSVDSKDIESSVLYSIVNIRSKNGLPTIVMTTFPMEPYIGDIKLRKYFWDDMLAYSIRSGEPSLDRLIHVSCYKVYKSDTFSVVKGVDY